MLREYTFKVTWPDGKSKTYVVHAKDNAEAFDILSDFPDGTDVTYLYDKPIVKGLAAIY